MTKKPKRRKTKSVDEQYHDLFSKTHGDRVEWFMALDSWITRESSSSKNIRQSSSSNESGKQQQQPPPDIQDKGEKQEMSYSTPRRRIQHVLYPGSFVHIAPSLLWPHVTYIDTDKRAARFFLDDPQSIQALIAQKRKDYSHHCNNPTRGGSTTTKNDDEGIATPSFSFVQADYNDHDKLVAALGRSPKDDDDDDENGREGGTVGEVDVKSAEALQFDLLISSYAGFVSRACRDFVRPGGLLVVNNSHGDASMAQCYQKTWKLVGVIPQQQPPQHKVLTTQLDDYMIPKRPEEASLTEADIELLGKGIAFTKSNVAAYVFERLDG